MSHESAASAIADRMDLKQDTLHKEMPGGRPAVSLKASIDPADQVVRIPLSELTPSPTNPRKHFDPKDINDIAESLKIRQIHNILVRPNKNGKGYEIVIGECRWRAAQVAKLPNLKAEIAKLDDVQALKLQLIENAKRNDITAMEEAHAIDDLMKRGKMTVADVAKETGFELRTVYNRLSLLKLPKEVIKHLETGLLTPKHAEIIGRVPKELQARALQASIQTIRIETDDDDGYDSGSEVQAAVPFRDLEQWIQRELYRELNGVPWKLDDAQLCPKAGACTACPKRSTEGKKETCVDAVCYNEKFEAHVAARIQTGLIAITDRYYLNSAEKGVVVKEQWTESKSAKAAPAILIDGTRAGQEIKIELKKDAPAAAKAAASPIDPETGKREPMPAKKAAPIAERRKNLDTRRLGWIQTELQNSRVPKTDFETIQKVHGDKWAQHVFTLSAIFGTSHRREGRANYYSGDKASWTAYLAISPDKSLEAAAEKLWVSTRKVLAARLTFRVLSDLDLPEAKKIAEFIGVKWSDLEAAAAAALPEPKSWALDESCRTAKVRFVDDKDKAKPGKISGKEIAAKIKAARSGKTPKTKKKK